MTSMLFVVSAAGILSFVSAEYHSAICILTLCLFAVFFFL